MNERTARANRTAATNSIDESRRPGQRPRLPRIAIVTAGLSLGGGIPYTVNWLYEGLHATGRYSVDIHDLATSSRDEWSRRLFVPSTWRRTTLQAAGGAADASTRWGANAVELEVMRYLPRQDLTEALKGYDLIQVIAGGPALAYVTRRLRVPTVLLAASLVDWERVSLLAQLGSRRPLVSTMTHLTTRVERAALRTADKILVMNSTLQARLRSYGHDNVEVAFPGVDVRRFVPHQSGWQRSGPIISVARLAEPRKRLDRTIWAYSLAVAADRNIPSLVLAGKGDLPAGLRALIDQLRLRSRVEVRQDLTAGQLQDLYQTASVFLQTSHEEGFGIAVLEAMASGLPVVATATAGTSETVVPGATGWLIPQMREVQLHRLIAEKLLEVLHGPGEELGKNGRARCIEAYSDEGALAPFIDTYERVRQTTDMRLEGLPSRGRSRFAR